MIAGTRWYLPGHSWVRPELREPVAPSLLPANGSRLGRCALALEAAASKRPPLELGLSPAEAMLAAAPAAAQGAPWGQCE